MHVCIYVYLHALPLLPPAKGIDVIDFFVPQAQTGKDRACGAAVSELQHLLSSKP